MFRKLICLISFVLVLALASTNVAFAQLVWEGRITSGADDVEDQLTRGMYNTSSDLEIFNDGGLQVIGLRFLNVQVTPGAVISKAYVEFECDELGGGTQPVNAIIEGELRPNAPAFTAAANNVTSRPRTKAKVVWTPVNWTAVDQKDQTSNIASIIEEIVGQPGWYSGNALVLIFSDDPVRPSTGVRIAEAYEGEPQNAALLHIEWSPIQKYATQPNPADDKTDVPRDVSLIWKPGAYADKHDVYLGTIFNDVNNASRTNPRGVLVSQNQVPDSYSPAAVLQWGQTYYWRIDEVNAPPTSNIIFKGEVWQFTVEPFAYPIAGTSITATASSQFSASTGPQNTINGSGLDAGDLHSTAESAIWLSSMTGAQPTWIQYEFDRIYKLYQMWVWNFNQAFEPVVGFGFKDVTIEYSTNGTNWTVLANVPQFARASGAAGYAHNTEVDLSSVVAKYVKITANSNFGGILPQYGLSEVRFYYVPVVAREPAPASGATDVPLGAIGALADVTLSFRAGREAAKHNVYFSDSSQAVLGGTAPVTTVTQARYGPLSLDLGKAYYWRVDEVNEVKTPTTWQGELWNFTTQQYFVVDDFEDYNDFEPDRVFDTWIDGWNVPANGSQVGYANPPFAERTIVHSGNQSMPFAYDNTAGATYSEAERTFASPQDWTVRGAKVLTLWFKGNPVAFLESPPGTFTMSGGGTDIWGTADQFRFAYKQLSGNGSITAKVLSVSNTNAWAKAGVMIRDSLNANSMYANAVVTPTSGVAFQRRLATGGSATGDTQAGIAAPQWVRVTRNGNTFTADYSANGTTWTALGTQQTIAMQSNAYIGLALTSHDASAICVAQFSNVSTTGNVTGVWQVAEIGVAQPSNIAAPVYVTLADSANKTATVKYPDPAATNINMWIGWNIDLSAFTGVNSRAIKKMIIGVGDKANPQTATGLVYFDDLRLYRLAPAYTVRIASGSDDAEQHLGDGSMDITSSDLELAYEDEGTPATDEQVIGLRFANIGLSKGALVTGAYLEFEVDETKGGTAPVNLIVEGELTPNAATFTSAANNITSRTSRTTAKVKWSVPPWTTVDEKFQTPDISSIIQEIVNQTGWARGNALVLFLRDDKSNPSTGIRCAEAYEGEATAAPLLCITSQ